MNTKQIDCCIELSRTQNFTRAAENLFVSQPSLSYQIKTLEEEVGFAIFERSGRGASLTPAGEQFCAYLVTMRSELRQAIEAGQNFSSQYRSGVSVGTFVRQALAKLPDAIRIMAERHPDVQVTPRFQYRGSIESFLKGETDVLLAFEDSVRQLPEVEFLPLYETGVYVIMRSDDALALLPEIGPEDLAGRVVMVGGGSPGRLRKVQQELIARGEVRYFNSPDHDSTLTNVAAGRGVCLAPGFLKDADAAYAWVPYRCEEAFRCVLCVHRGDVRPAVRQLVAVMRELYGTSED